MLTEIDDGHSSTTEVGPAVHTQRHSCPHLALNAHLHIHLVWLHLTIGHSCQKQKEEETVCQHGRHGFCVAVLDDEDFESEGMQDCKALQLEWRMVEVARQGCATQLCRFLAGTGHYNISDYCSASVRFS